MSTLFSFCTKQTGRQFFKEKENIMGRETKRLLLCWGKVACKLLNLGAFTPGKTARLQFEAFTFL